MRKLAGVLLTAAMVLPVGVLAASPAGSAAATPTCSAAKGTFKFTPGLPVKTTIKGGSLTSAGTFSTCTGGGVKSATSSFKSTKSTTAAGCSTLVKPDPKSKGTLGTFTIKWNTGASSVAKTFYVKQLADLVDASTTGKITSGPFLGKTITGTVTFKLAAGSCVSKPATGGTYVNKKGTKLVIK